jgi:phytoene/squalene synthetase
MYDYANVPDGVIEEENQSPQRQENFIEPQNSDQYPLPEIITKAASRQTYYTIRFLADHELAVDAYRAYAYFRWVDDMVDMELSTTGERIAFLKRQQTLINSCYQDEPLGSISPEETILAELIQHHPQPCTGLEHYIRNMMAVMAFDAERKGQLISQQELTQYSRHLATAVTEALLFFIGHDDLSPQTPLRYLAVTGAHITHMLRDTVEDAAAGYFNIPCEFLKAHQLDPCDIKSPAYVQWVKSRVLLARSYFTVGKSYLAQIKNWRCRLAGYAYTARFEEILNMIERDRFQLRPDYSERKSLPNVLRMSEAIFSMLLKDPIGGNS